MVRLISGACKCLAAASGTDKRRHCKLLGLAQKHHSVLERENPTRLDRRLSWHPPQHAPCNPTRLSASSTTPGVSFRTVTAEMTLNSCLEKVLYNLATLASICRQRNDMAYRSSRPAGPPAQPGPVLLPAVPQT